MDGEGEPRARPPMRRGLKPTCGKATKSALWTAARAAPYEKGTETFNFQIRSASRVIAARAAPYEKGTETDRDGAEAVQHDLAARAAPYEKGTETCRGLWACLIVLDRRARGPL